MDGSLLIYFWIHLSSSSTPCSSIYLSIYPSFYSSIHPSYSYPFVYLLRYQYHCSSIHPSIHPSIHLSIHLSIDPAVCPLVHMSVLWSICLPIVHITPLSISFIHPSICPLIHLSVHRSICLSIVHITPYSLLIVVYRLQSGFKSVRSSFCTPAATEAPFVLPILLFRHSTCNNKPINLILSSPVKSHAAAIKLGHSLTMGNHVGEVIVFFDWSSKRMRSRE